MKRKPETKEELEMIDRFNLIVKRIKFLSDMRQDEIAERMGISRSTLSEICNGQRVCTGKVMAAASELNSSVALESEKRQMMTRGTQSPETAEDDYKVKYEELLAKYQSLVEDYQKLVNKMMGLN